MLITGVSAGSWVINRRCCWHPASQAPGVPYGWPRHTCQPRGIKKLT